MVSYSKVESWSGTLVFLSWEPCWSEPIRLSMHLYISINCNHVLGCLGFRYNVFQIMFIILAFLTILYYMCCVSILLLPILNCGKTKNYALNETQVFMNMSIPFYSKPSRIAHCSLLWLFCQENCCLIMLEMTTWKRNCSNCMNCWITNNWHSFCHCHDLHLLVLINK